MPLDGRNEAVGAPLVAEIVHKLKFLCRVGLGYLELGRRADTCLCGEAQRIPPGGSAWLPIAGRLLCPG